MKKVVKCVIGFDPGTQITGWGVVTITKKPEMLGVGTIKPNRNESMAERLLHIYNEARKLIEEFSPELVAVEDPFVGKSAASALVLGQARGTLLLAGASSGLRVESFAPRAIKSSVAGRGNASKEQVQYMVQKLLNLKSLPEPLDASDALAVALCYVNRGAGAVKTDKLKFDPGKLAKNSDDIEAIMRWKSGGRRRK